MNEDLINISDEELMTMYAQFIITDRASLPIFKAIERNMRKRGLDKPVKLTLTAEQAVRLAYLFDRIPGIDLDKSTDDRPEQLTHAAQCLAWDEYYQLPYAFFIENDGWRGRAAASQGQPI